MTTAPWPPCFLCDGRGFIDVDEADGGERREPCPVCAPLDEDDAPFSDEPEPEPDKAKESVWHN